MNCERCDRGRQAIARVKSEILDLAICDLCAFEAVNSVGPKPDELTITFGMRAEEMAAG